MYSFNGPVYPNLSNVDIADPKLPTPRKKEGWSSSEWNNLLRTVKGLLYSSYFFLLGAFTAEHRSLNKMPQRLQHQNTGQYILHPEKQYKTPLPAFITHLEVNGVDRAVLYHPQTKTESPSIHQLVRTSALLLLSLSTHNSN